LTTAIDISHSNFGLKFAPDSIHRAFRQDDWGRSCIWGVAMGTNPPNTTHDRRDESRPRADENSEDDIVSLLEENARLRGLVVKLSDLVLRSVVERR